MTKYLSETSKSFRYEKIQEAIEKEVYEHAKDYISTAERKRADHDDDGNWHEWTATDEQIDEEAYAHACEKVLQNIEDSFKSKELYWIVEIMLQENFDYEPSAENPYAVHKKPEPKMEVELTPFGIMMNIK